MPTTSRSSLPTMLDQQSQSQALRIRKSSQAQDVISVPPEFLDTTCYFITATAFDTLLQQTSNGLSSSPPRSDIGQKSLWTSSTHFFTGSLVCTEPVLILATGSAVPVLEQEWENFYVLLDFNGVAPYGRLPSVFSTVERVHAISKGYPLDSFGEIPWLLLELAPLRNHIPSREPRGKVRTRWRSNSLPSPQTPEEAYTPELNPSLSVCFDLNQASQTPSPQNSSPSNSNSSNSYSMFFRQAPTRSIHSLVRARLSCLFSTTSSCIVTVRLYFGSNPTSSSHQHHHRKAPWTLDEGLMIAINDGVVSDEDSWLLGGHGQPYLTADREYNFTLVSGLAGDGVYATPAAIFRQMRLIRRRSSWSGRDTEAIWPQAYVEVTDSSDPRLNFSLGPVAFDASGMRGREWVGIIPSCIEC